MIQLLLLTLLIIFITWLGVRWRRLHNYWADRGVPFIPRHPLVGSLSFVLNGNLTQWMRQTYTNYKAPYVGIWMFWRPALVIHSPEIIRNVLTRDSATFRDRFASSGSSDPLGALNIFTVNDPLWSAIRRRLSLVFTASKLRSLQTLISCKTTELKQRIETEKEKCACLRTIFADYTTDIIGAVTFGVAGEATLTGGGPMRKVTRGFTEFNLYRGINWCSVFFWPELVDIFRFSVFPKSTTKYFRKLFGLLMNQRKDEIKEITDPKNILDALLQLSQQIYSDDLMVAQAAVFLFAGVDSTATTLTFITYELAYNSDIQEKLYQELLEAKLKSENDDIIDTKILSNLEYLNRIIKEAVRKYTAMGWLDRIASSDYKVDDKLTIKAGTPVIINTTGLHFDPEFFPDPEKFDPDRFTPENEKKIKPFTYLPFGDGPRICIGLRFAYMHIQHVLSAMILDYEVRPLAKEPKPRELKFDNHSLFLSPAKPLHVQFVPRTVV